MSKKNILAEAIADAKSIKEAALANAKAAIAETFTPTLKSLISAELREELADDLDARGKATSEADGNEDDEMDEEDGYKKSSKDKHQSDEKETKRHGSDSEEPSMSKADREISELDALLRELESGEDDDSEDKLDEKGKNPFAEPDFNAAKNDQDKIKPMDEEGDEEEGKDKKDSKYELYLKLKKEFEPKPSEKPKDENKKDGEGDEKDGDEQGADDDFDIESIIRELEGNEDESSDDSDGVDEEDGYDKKVNEKKRNPFAQQDFNASKDDSDKIKPMDEKKFMAEINKIKKELRETNLMNAKLLYFGKVIKEQDGLTKTDKVGILKQFDKANTVNEAKMIYGVITESMKSNKTKKSNKQLKENLGFASKASGVATKKETSKESVISEETVNRFRHLAGLTNPNN